MKQDFPDDLPLADIDLSQIFISREEQIDQFRFYFDRWKRLVAVTPTIPTVSTVPPSPNEKIQSLIVLINGRGGFGKSTLLKCYREITLEVSGQCNSSNIVDWEFAAQEKRAILNPAPGEEVDALQYFDLLHEQLVIALNKKNGDFKEYHAAVKVVNDVRKQAHGILDVLPHEDSYAWLRGLAGEAVLTLVRLTVPASNAVLSNEKIAEKVKEITGEGVQIGAEQVKQVWEALHHRLGSKLNDYLEPALRLGKGLGEDLASFAKKRPILIFFDTYEEVDEADAFLRVVMGGAGLRVGWVIAGRDNLWAGLSQRLRNVETEYGYKDLVPPDRRLAIDFSANGVGDFTLSDITEYFSQLSILSRSLLPPLSEKDAAHILDATQGVPLAVKIAASLYLEKPDIRLITEGIEGKREIVDQMVRRYLLHTRTNQSDRSRLYGLALLRRADETRAIVGALDLPHNENYSAELSRLHRRYGFIFTQQEEPSLHQEVRHFLRLWLLEHFTEPGVVHTAQRLKEIHVMLLKELEDQQHYVSLRERLVDEQWIGRYLDLIEQSFWFNPVEGIAYALPFMFAASIYRRDANREVVRIGKFFEAVMPQPHARHWNWAVHSLIYSTSRNPLAEELIGLEALVKLTSQKEIDFFPPIPGSHNELEAALWWRMGEAYQGKNERKALEWYQRALSQLDNEIELHEIVAETIWTIAHIQEEGQQDDNDPALRHKKKYQPLLQDLDQKLLLYPDDVRTYVNRGKAHAELNNLQQALQDFNHALELDPTLATAYLSRGETYLQLNQHQQAINDFDLALELDPTLIVAYLNRGKAYTHLHNYKQAISDFDRVFELDPKLISASAERDEAYQHLRDDSLVNDVGNKQRESEKIKDYTAVPISPLIPPKLGPHTWISRRSIVVAVTLLLVMVIISSWLLASRMQTGTGHVQNTNSVNDTVCADISSSTGASGSNGCAFFIDSGQLSPDMTSGTNDELKIVLHNIPTPSPGKSYYAWLLGDRLSSSSTIIPLGPLHLVNGSVDQLYMGDQKHTSLLPLVSRLLVSEEDSSFPPATFSPDHSMWRYYGQLSQSINPHDKLHFSVLDYLRHLLSNSPALSKRGIHGGLNTWFLKNAQTIVEWTNTARDNWRISSDTLHRQLIRILDYLDGKDFVKQDLAAGDPVMLADPVGSSIGLLGQPPDPTDPPGKDYIDEPPPGYIYLISGYLTAIVQAPDATVEQHVLVSQMNGVIDLIKQWLKQIHEDAKKLVSYSAEQLSTTSALTRLNDMVTVSQYVMNGVSDPTSESTSLRGAVWLCTHISYLAAFNIKKFSIQ